MSSHATDLSVYAKSSSVLANASLRATVHWIDLSIIIVSYLYILCYYFNCISFAIRLSGRKVAIKLID